MKSNKIRIRIVNPVPGEAKFTSLDAANRHVEAKLATWTKDGQLFFYDNKRVSRSQFDAEQELYDRSIRHSVLWHGSSDHVGTHEPGHVRS